MYQNQLISLNIQVLLESVMYVAVDHEGSC